jgi:hypothetical protein
MSNRLASCRLLLACVALAGASPLQAGGMSDKLLLASAWCSFSYSQTSGTTRTTRAQFYRDGTYRFGNQRESHSSGQYGSVYGQGAGGGGGRWKVQGGELLMSEGAAPLEKVQTVLKRNSNGYPIIVADGVEYMQCQ